MAVTDLTNTVWKLDDGIRSGEAEITYNVDFLCVTSTFHSIKFEMVSGPGSGIYYNMWYDNVLAHTYFDGTQRGTWWSSDYEMIKFTGGTDVTNASLISILNAFGTLTNPKTEFITNMNLLADAINDKAGTTGAKTIQELITAVRSIGE